MASEDFDREFNHDPVVCEDCGEFVVVTLDEERPRGDGRAGFECGCRRSSPGASKPESWTGGEFL